MGKSATTFHDELNNLKEDLVKMGGMVERSIHRSFKALSDLDADTAKEIIRRDRDIDLMQNSIEKQCLALMATQQPVAVDLRFLAGAVMVCLFMERMGDQAVNLAWRALTLCQREPAPLPSSLLTMAEIAKEMVRDCLDAVARDDVNLARYVIKRDDELDKLNRSFLMEMVQGMIDENRLIRRRVEYILASRHLERIGDEATNVAEQVVFLVEGRMIRHAEKEPSVGPL